MWCHIRHSEAITGDTFKRVQPRQRSVELSVSIKLGASGATKEDSPRSVLVTFSSFRAQRGVDHGHTTLRIGIVGPSLPDQRDENLLRKLRGLQSRL